MDAAEGREAVTEARRALDRAMRALSVPNPDEEAAIRSLRACADLYDWLIVRIVSDRLGGGSWRS